MSENSSVLKPNYYRIPGIIESKPKIRPNPNISDITTKGISYRKMSHEKYKLKIDTPRLALKINLNDTAKNWRKSPCKAGRLDDMRDGLQMESVLLYAPENYYKPEFTFDIGSPIAEDNDMRLLRAKIAKNITPDQSPLERIQTPSFNRKSGSCIRRKIEDFSPVKRNETSKHIKLRSIKERIVINNLHKEAQTPKCANDSDFMGFPYLGMWGSEKPETTTATPLKYYRDTPLIGKHTNFPRDIFVVKK